MSKKQKIDESKIVEGVACEVVEDETIENEGSEKKKSEKFSLRRAASNVWGKIPGKVKVAGLAVASAAVGGGVGYVLGKNSGDDATDEEYYSQDLLEDYSEDGFTVDETEMAESEAPAE